MGLSKLHYIWGARCRDSNHKYMTGIILRTPIADTSNFRHQRLLVMRVSVLGSELVCRKPAIAASGATQKRNTVGHNGGKCV